MEKLISVIVPVYNVENFIINSINSIINQTYKNIEIILIDDGSTDNSGKICDEFGVKDNRIKVFHIENQGVSNARNFGMDHMNGDLVTFVDSDDMLAPNMLEDLYNNIIKTDADCSMCTFKELQDGITHNADNSYSSRDITILTREDALEELFYMKGSKYALGISAVWGILYKKSLLENTRYNNRIRIGEDFEFKYRVFQKINCIACIDNEAYYYVIRQDSALRNGFNIKKMDTLYEFEKILLLEKENKYYNDLLVRVVNIAIVLLFMIPINSKYEIYRIQIIDFVKRYRICVLKNHKIRLKVRLALVLSYIGFNNIQRLYKEIQK